MALPDRCVGVIGSAHRPLILSACHRCSLPVLFVEYDLRGAATASDAGAAAVLALGHGFDLLELRHNVPLLFFGVHPSSPNCQS